MARIFYLHWNQDEAEERMAELEAAGHEVRLHWSAGEQMRLGERLPEAFVISLDRLPSHGRAVAEWLREAKKRRSIPLIFCGGKPDKVDAMRERFPEAIFCGSGELLSELARVTPDAAGG